MENKNYSRIIKKFQDLINTFGTNGTLNVFFDGIEATINDSTIDCIEDIGINILFYYNGNTYDYDTIRAFTIDDLEKFYADLFDELNHTPHTTTYVEEYINRKMSSIISDNSDRQTFVFNVIDAVIQDINECADVHNWNNTDIDIALARVLVNGKY